MTSTKTKDRWQFERIGMGYRLYAEEAGIELLLGRLKRSGQELQGELSIRVNWKGVKTVNGTLHQARFNVSSVAARASLTKHLKTRTDKTEFAEMDWGDALEHLCQMVMEAEREGEPVYSLNGTAPARAEHRYAIAPICPHGVVTWVYGPGGKGKSLFGTALALSVAKGVEIVPGLSPQLKGPVLYLDFETDRATMHERVQFIANGHGFKTTKDFYYRRCYRPIADDVEEIARIIAEHGIKFVVIDSAGPAIGAHGEYGDANEGTLKLFAAIRIFGVTTVVIDHVSKTEIARNQKGEAIGAMPYGSVYKINLSRSAWELQSGEASDDDNLHVRLVNTKSNDARRCDPIDLSILWSIRDNVIMFDEDMGYRPSTYYDAPPPPEEGPSTKPDQKTAIIDYLSGKPDGATRAEIQIACRIRSDGRVRTIIGENPGTFQKVYGTNPPKYTLVKEGGM